MMLTVTITTERRAWFPAAFRVLACLACVGIISTETASAWLVKHAMKITAQ